MFQSRKAQYIFVFVLISYTNAGMIQDFIQSFNGNKNTESPKETSYGYGNSTVTNNKNLVSIARGYSSHYEQPQHHATHHSYYHQDNNMDLYGLLAGLSFASLLGATIIYLATRNTTGRRRRSLDLDEDMMDGINDALEEPFWEKDKVTPFKLYEN